MQGLSERPDCHLVWTCPNGIEYEQAMKNVGKDKCWCGKAHRKDHWTCSSKCNAVFWRQIEYWKDVRQKMIRHATECHICAKPFSTISKHNTLYNARKNLRHITPITEGGPMWDASNMQVICDPCYNAEELAESTARAMYSKQAGFFTLDVFHEARATCP